MLIVTILLCYFSNVLKVNEIRSSTGRNQVVQEFNAEYKDSIDVLLAGDSTSLNSFVPAKLWKDEKITSYALGYGYAYPSEIYFDIKKIFERQKPKILLLEVSFMVGELEVIDNNLYCQDTVNGLVDYFNDELLGNINYIFPVMKYKSSFKDKTLGDMFTIKPKALNNIYKGYSIKKNVLAPSEKLKPEKNTDLINNGEIYTRKIKNLCEKNNCKMILIFAPQIACWTEVKHNIILNLSEKLGVEFVDYNVNTDKLIKNFSWNTDTADGGTHLNYSGATKVTNAIKNLILNDDSFCKSSFDQKIIKKWNKDSEDFFREMEGN